MKAYHLPVKVRDRRAHVVCGYQVPEGEQHPHWWRRHCDASVDIE